MNKKEENSSSKYKIWFIQITIVATIVITTLLALPSLLKQREFKTFDDEQLRKRALDRGMASIPKTYTQLLKVIDTPSNPMSIEKIHLGKELYFDTLLSKNRNISCATCHMIKKDNHRKSTTLLDTITAKGEDKTNCVACHLEEESGTDRMETAIGDEGKRNPFNLNTLTVLNSSLAKYLTWSGEGKSVEERAGVAINAPFEMNLTPQEVEERLNSNPAYVEKFQNVFKNSSSVSFQNTQKAIGAYVRTLLTRGSYDEFLDGDNNAISAQAKRGLTNFINLGCKGCHTGMSVGGQSMQRFPIRHFATIHDLRPNFTIYPEIKRVEMDFPFENKGGFKGQKITNKFRVPILRNVTKTSPYFHNGAVDKIREAVQIMGKNQLGINLTAKQIDELVAFLQTLEGTLVDYKIDNKNTEGKLHENNKS